MDTPADRWAAETERSALRLQQRMTQARALEDLLDSSCPVVGSGDRWYDRPYRMLWNARQGRENSGRDKGWVHAISSHVERELFRRNALDRERARSPLDAFTRINIPDGEAVKMPAIWVCEFFLPSHAKNLNRAIRKLGWREKIIVGEPNNEETLQEARQGLIDHGSGWPLGHLNETSKRLPAEHFRSVHAKVIEVSPSMTAVVATFLLKDSSQSRVDSMWRSNHEPIVAKSEGHSYVLDRRMNGHRRTQQERQSLHAHAREWMHENFPGAFAEGTNGRNQPLVDMLILSTLDPLNQSLPSNEVISEYVGALGIGSLGAHVVCDCLPGLVLERQIFNRSASRSAKRSWSLWGQQATLRRLQGEEGGRFAEIADGPIAQELVWMSVSELLALLAGRYAELRDSAVKSHSRHSWRPLEVLRRTLLQLSLDAGMVSAEILRSDPGWTRPRTPAEAFRYDRSHMVNLTGPEFETDDPVLEDVRESTQKRLAREIVAADSQYRDVLSTAIVIGSSIDSFRTQRISIGIAVGSFVAALVAVMISLKPFFGG